jgi:multidrug efflux pump
MIVRITDIFVTKPVLSVVVSVFVLLLGGEAIVKLPVRQFPKTVNARINVETDYYGADAEVMAGFITQPLENAIAHADGIDYMASDSMNGQSNISVHLRLNQDPDRALTEIQSRISAVSNQLPPGSQVPIISLQTGDSNTLLFMGFSSHSMSAEQITDYLRRVVQPVLQSVQGVQDVHVEGGQAFALRAWLDPAKLAARGLTAADVYAALTTNDFVTGAGVTTGQMTSVNLGVTTGLHSERGFRDMVIKQSNGAIVRLGDVAKVELGADQYGQSLLFDGAPGVFVEVEALPSANVLDVAARARAKFDELRPGLPQGLIGTVQYDATDSIHESIDEVATTLGESLLIVTIVVFFFLRSPHATMIPVITIPLSLIGTFGILWLCGFSINLLTLLALVLATGLVVDDAIIVVENISREMAQGATRVEAALCSARQLASPIIAMTIVLVAVYVPIALRTGLTGALFTEFAMTMVGSVTVSAVLALTLSPMMCRYLLKPHREGKMVRPFYDRAYAHMLRAGLNVRYLVMLFGIGVLVSGVLLYRGSKSELAPQEDDSFIVEQATVPATATVDYLRLYEPQISAIYASVPERQSSWQIDVPGQVQGGLVLKPLAQRHRSATAILNELQAKFANVAGENIALFQPPSLPGSWGLPVSYVLKTTRNSDELDKVSALFLQQAQASGKFAFVDRDLKIDLPQATVVVDRNKVAALGLDMTRVGNVLNTMLSGGYVNYFSMAGRAYKVIPQVDRGQRLNPSQLENYTIADQNGVPIPLSSVAHIETKTVPEVISHFQQMNAATISGVPMPGVTEADALKTLDAIAARMLPAGYATDTSSGMRQFVQESSGFAATFGFAVLVIYLSLAALFGSFRDPLIILVSVPMSLSGALLFIYLGVHGATLNIYTQVGLLTLMGLISKHGILMVEVANEQQALGMGKRAAIEHAALLRLRPILMTTAAMVLGVVPLVLATGAGSAARFAMGLVIASGLSIGTLFTLFVVPAFYLTLARSHAGDVMVEARTRGLHPRGAMAE